MRISDWSSYVCSSDLPEDASPEQYLDHQHFGDIRSIDPGLLRNRDAVIHLAAISNDPMGNRFAKVTKAINLDSSIRLGQLAAAAGVRNFIFASSCSVYGVAKGGSPQELGSDSCRERVFHYFLISVFAVSL